MSLAKSKPLHAQPPGFPTIRMPVSSIADDWPALSMMNVLSHTRPAITAGLHPSDTVAAIDVVRWTVDGERPISLGSIAQQWGVWTRDLKLLNPQLSDRGRLAMGTELVVYRADPTHRSRSIGAPNRGSLRWGMPMPEGSHWRLRDRRLRSFGTQYMVEALVEAFEQYAEAYPDGPELRLGDLSHRRGGALFPHVSHRTGRDIDIGVVLYEEKRKDRYWENATETNFDAEKTWFVIRALIQTGRVQEIFLSRRLQRMMVAYAVQDLGHEGAAAALRVINDDYSSPSVVRHWKGHRDHMHVRFRCTPGNYRCVRQSYQ